MSNVITVYKKHTEYTQAVCGKCKTYHQTTTYMAARYPDDECLACKSAEKIHKQWKETVDSMNRLATVLAKYEEALKDRRVFEEERPFSV